MRILYIGTHKIDASGAGVVNRMHQKVLEEISDGNVDYLEPDTSFIAKFSLGISSKVLSKLDNLLKYNSYDFVFVSVSQYGRAVKFIKHHYPHIVIVSFYHNIERHYASEYYKSTGLRALPFLLTSIINERKAVQYSDKNIVLNYRDAKLMKDIYNTDADYISPVCVFDRYYPTINTQLQDIGQIDYLFVGVAFFANIRSVQWFIDNVMPHVPGTLCVVGKGMDNVPFSNLNNRIKIFGFVPSLDAFYAKACCVVSPILEGGGMKTKTAEALMFGKMIIGSEEAFEGYEIDPICMHLCKSAEDYIIALNSFDEEKKCVVRAARNLYLTKYSYNNKLNLFKKVFC